MTKIFEGIGESLTSIVSSSFDEALGLSLCVTLFFSALLLWLFIGSLGWVAGLIGLLAVIVGLCVSGAWPFLSGIALGALLKVLNDSLDSLAGIWFKGAAHDNFFLFLRAENYLTVILVASLVLFVLSLFVDMTQAILKSFVPIRIQN